MPSFLEITIPLFTTLIMFTVGTGLTLADFRQVARAPRKVIVAGLAQIVCLPAVGLIVVEVLAPSDFVAAGVLLIAACPGGSISNFYTYLARANVALSVVLTGLSCLVAVVTMPLVMSGFERFADAPATFRVPVAELITTLVVYLLLPIVLGMLVRHRLPALVARGERWLRGGSMALLAAMVIQILWRTSGSLGPDLPDTIAASAAMAGLAALAGAVVGGAMKLEARDLWTVVIEVMVQNVALASTIAVVVFQQAGFASFAAVYFLVQVPFAAAAVGICLWTQAERRRRGYACRDS